MDTVLGHHMHLEDGTVYLTEERIVKQVSLSALIDEASKHQTEQFTTTPLMPAKDGTCRLYAKCGNNVGFLMQNNPSVRVVNYDTRSRGGEKHFTVSMPWIWVFCRFMTEEDGRFRWVDCHLCATYRNLQTLQDPIYLVPLPNQYSNGVGKMCTGSALTGASSATDAPGLICVRWMTQLWASVFNSDLTTSFPAWMLSGYDRNNGGDYIKYALTKWEKKTAENPAIGLSPEMGLLSYTAGSGGLEGFIKHCLAARR